MIFNAKYSPVFFSFAKMTRPNVPVPAKETLHSRYANSGHGCGNLNKAKNRLNIMFGQRLSLWL